ncbi:di-trans,poly-cis-decaprenylcistransferase [Pelagibacterales bacterium SAG-MED32]|nr:di-trans,poly-cis-decaprenylcistransferase [Pelagibacterales bacterium SAG-MED32]
MKASNSRKKTINHVAIIMDGNGRWSIKNSISKKKGHEYGVRNCISICESLDKLDFIINEISFYIFSTENWKRSPIEVKNLFSLIETFYLTFKNTANKKNMVVRHYGSREKLSKKLLNIIDDVVLNTKSNNGTRLNLMFNYGARKEIEDAIKKIRISKNNTYNFRDYLYVSDSSDPDLIIRTGGELRLSNFMLWQSAYSELYFTKTLWPDFKIRSLNRVLHGYSKRNRKLGR